MSLPQTARRNSLRRVRLQLVEMIRDADCWRDIEEAARAMFHAKLIWSRYDDAMNRHECEFETASRTKEPAP